MGIFKDRKFFGKEALKKSLLWKKIYNGSNRVLLFLGIVINVIMFFLMMNDMSPAAAIFGINLYFLFMILKGRKLKID